MEIIFGNAKQRKSINQTNKNKKQNINNKTKKQTQTKTKNKESLYMEENEKMI